MWKAPASVLCGCLAALPLMGCAGHVATSGQAAAVTPAAMAEPAPYYAPAPRVYAVGPAAPAAVLVLWPGDDNLALDPALWTAQGFDVVTPPPADIYQLVANQQAALARLVASAHALADAPVWVVGSGPVIAAALAAPQFGRGVSGVVMTSVTSGAGSCSESSLLLRPGHRGAPQSRGHTVRRLRCGHARDWRAAAVSASDAVGSPAEPAAPYRGIGGGEEFAVGRKGAGPRRADQINAPRLRGTGPALAASAGPVFGQNG